MENICYICLDNIESYIKPYKCNHNIHIECSKKWKHECPVCKSPKKLPVELEFRDNNYFYKVGQTNGMPVTLSNYVCQWDKTKCNSDTDIHNITFNKNYGIIGVCSCKSIQLFNWLE